MAKTKLQEFVLSFKNERRDNNEILIIINTMDEARQVVEMMNKIGMCHNYNAWVDPMSKSGLNGFKHNKSTHMLIDIYEKVITYSGDKQISELKGEKLAYINAREYTVKRERKKLTL
jgi:hypothetical protein